MVANPVYYSQEDPRWRNTPYTIIKDPKQTIGTSACGPTCFAMVASTFGRAILPPEAAAFAVERGYRTSNNGTAWDYFEAVGRYYGLVCKRANFSEMKSALAAGALVIASMKPGHMTGGGHYVLLTGIAGRWISVHDPNHDNTKYGTDGLIDQGVKDDGRVRADLRVFELEARQYWIFTPPVIPAKEEEEAMTTKEREAMDLLQRQVNEQSSLIGTLAMRVKALEEPASAPKWFVKEFEKDKVLEMIDSPLKPTVFWETLAVSLRMQGMGNGRKSK